VPNSHFAPIILVQGDVAECLKPFFLQVGIRMPNVTTKVVKVPVRIVEEDKELRILKYKALDEVMRESRYLGNMAIRYAIAFKLEGIPKEIDEKKGTPVPLDTRIYRILAQRRKYLDAGTVATLSRNFALKVLKNSDKDAWEGKKSLPTYRSLFVPFRHQGTLLTVDKQDDPSQFIIEPPFGRKWLSDDLIGAVKRDVQVKDEQRKLTLASCFSRKDHGAKEVVKRIATGEYLMSDSQIKISGKNLTVYLTYRLKQVQPELDPEKVCGVNLGAVVPAVCAVNFGPQRLFIGNGSDVWAVQSKYRAERRRKDRRLGSDAGTTRWEKSEKEERWLHTYCHALTRQVIRFCLQQGCGKIQLAVSGKSRRGEQQNRSMCLVSAPSKFYALLDYKAKELGIRVMKIDAGHSGCRCSECGHTATENRKTESLFVCVQCGRRVNADYNAARNISLASSETVDPGDRQQVQVSDERVPWGGAMPLGMVLRPVLRPRTVRGAVATAYE
jgi:hypothetical protein